MLACVCAYPGSYVCCTCAHAARGGLKTKSRKACLVPQVVVTDILLSRPYLFVEESLAHGFVGLGCGKGRCGRIFVRHGYGLRYCDQRQLVAARQEVYLSGSLLNPRRTSNGEGGGVVVVSRRAVEGLRWEPLEAWTNRRMQGWKLRGYFSALQQKSCRPFLFARAAIHPLLPLRSRSARMETAGHVV